MFLKLQPLLASFLFFLGLEFIAIKESFVLSVAALLLIFSIYQGRRLGGRWIFSVLPALYALSSVALLYLIALGYEQHIFIFLASAMYYLGLFGAYRLGRVRGDLTARGMNTAASASAVFFAFAGAYGLYLNFLVPLAALMLAYLVVTLLVSYQHFIIIRGDTKKLAILYSFLLALAMSEMIWTMNFWPFGYLTTGVIALILYYVLWDIAQSYFLDLLSRQRVVAHAAIFSVLITLILLSSKWIPVI